MSRRSNADSHGTRLTLALALFGLAGPGHAADASTASFRTTSEVVSVDAIALDTHGKPVEGLTVADFELSEDGQPQTLTSFEAVTMRESASAPAARSRVTTNAQPAARSERSFVIVFDDLNISQYTVETARKAIRDFLEAGLQPGDLATIVPSSGGPWWTERLPEGLPALSAFLERLQSRYRPDTSNARLGDYEALQIYYGRDPQIMSQVLRRYYENGILTDLPGDARGRAELQISPGELMIKARATEMYQQITNRLKQTLGTFGRVAAALAETKGRKTVLFLSEGFVHDSTQPAFRELVRLARQANAAFYFVDARGLLGAAGSPGGPGAAAEDGRLSLDQDTLGTLANPRRDSEGADSVALDTGGFSIRNTNNLAERMKVVADESRSYYLLGFIPANSKRDGKFRKLQVRVKRADVTVRARRGYYATSDADPQPTGKGVLDPRVRAALDAPVATGELTLRLVAHAFGPSVPGKSAVLLVAEVDLAHVSLKVGADKRHAGVLETYLVLTAANQSDPITQEKLMELSLPEDALQALQAHGLPFYRDFQLAPGKYQVRLLVRDRESGRVGAVRHEFSVPDPGTLSTSTPILTDRLQPQAAGGQGRPLPVAHRTFPTGARLVYTYELYGARRDNGGAPRLTASYEVRRADGSTLTPKQERPLEADPQGQIAQILPISLQGVPAGDYELVVVIRDEVAGRSLEISDVFSVVG